MRSRLVAGCLAAALLAVSPTPASAASVIPAETGVELSSGARSAIVGDVDGDGIRELVRVLRWQNDPGRLAVEVTSVDAAGRLVSGGQVLLRRAASPDDVFDGGPQVDRDGMLVVGAAEPARLLAWRVDGVERVIVAGIGTQGLPRPCCLTLWQVGLGSDGDTELRLLINTQRSASSIQAVDLDGDGTDEVVVRESPDPDQPDEVQVDVLRWRGQAFSMASRMLTPAPGSVLFPLGESDGRPGEELGLIAVPDQANVPVLLHRISLEGNGAPRTELRSLPFSGQLASMHGPSGGRIVLASPGVGVRLLAWPTGGDIRVDASSPQGGVPLGVLGTAVDARLLLQDGGVVHVLDERLAERGTIDRSEVAALFADSFLPPYRGPLPGGLAGGGPAVVFRGRLVTVASGAREAGADPLRDRLVAALPGITPIGLFGPEQAWTALAAAPAFEAERYGGGLTTQARIGPVRVTVAATDEVLQPEVDGGVLQPTVREAVPDPRAAGGALVLAGEAFEVEFSAPAGSELTLENGNFGDLLRTQTDRGGATRLTVAVPPSPDDQNLRFTARLQVVTPAGHGYVTRWEVEVLREPPRLVATTPIAPLSFSVPLTGQTDPGATVLVDDVPVSVDAEGRFQADVGAGPIPRDVRIVVSDPVGNTTRRTVSVVGLVDFRRLPWIPVVAVLTILAGAVLYLRAPRPGRPAVRPAGDDATFEEID